MNAPALDLEAVLSAPGRIRVVAVDPWPVVRAEIYRALGTEMEIILITDVTEATQRVVREEPDVILAPARVTAPGVYDFEGAMLAVAVAALDDRLADRLLVCPPDATAHTATDVADRIRAVLTRLGPHPGRR